MIRPTRNQRSLRCRARLKIRDFHCTHQNLPRCSDQPMIAAMMASSDISIEPPMFVQPKLEAFPAARRRFVILRIMDFLFGYWF